MARGYNKRGGRGGGGGRGRGRGRGGGGGRGGGNSRQYQDNRQSFDEVPKTNEKFERFYNTIDIVPAGEQRDKFWAHLRKELPNSFRFTGSKGHALSVRNNLTERFFPIIKEIKHEGKPVELPIQIAWYPSGLAYRMTTPKNVIRKYEPFKEFQRFLVSETGVGNISRQEEVSMIPPLLLDVRPEHTVLDLCAAPGSKSAQLVEAIHAGEEERVARAIAKIKGQEGNGAVSEGDIGEDDGRSTGLLIANDVNYSRAQMLVHQVKRLNSPNLLVTNHDATMFPSIELSTPEVPGQPKRRKYLKFDRILADVPCSGDGTCRKNPGIWKDWSPQNGLGLYITQVRILTRSLQMLKVGGRVVYSTCSMNPVENEAVIASAIERCGGVGKVKLIDCSDRLPGLARNEGLKDWSIMSRQGQIYESFPEAEQYEAEGSKIVPGMFAPGPEERIPLERCMRVYPHQQDTGGFFIAVLEKQSEIRAKAEADSKCMKRDWTFEEAEKEPMPKVDASMKTAFSEVMEEVEHPREPREVEAIPDSAASIQNDADVPDADAGASRLKRKQEHIDAVEGEGMAKKARTDDAGDAVEVMENGIAAGESVPVTEEVADAVQEAPFEKTVPGDMVQPVRRKRGRDEQPNEEAFKYLAPDHPELESIYAFYELHPSFPRDRFLVRNPAGDPVKGIYYSSQLVKDILLANEGRGMKFVHGGVKMFMKQDAQGQDICRWRIQTEGLPIVEGWVGDSRVVRLWSRTTLRKLLVEMFPKIGAADTPEGDGWRTLGEIGEQVLNIGMGCCVLRVEARGGEDSFEEEIVLPLWRSMHSLNLMLPKEDRRAMLLRLYNEDVELLNHTDKSQRRTQEPKGGAPEGSKSAQADAEELNERMAGNGGEDDSAILPKELAAIGGDSRSSSLEPELQLQGRALKEDAVAKEDRMQAATLEAKEDEDAKIAAAMPERAGEGDEMNTTV